jgi:hypothetical protein
MNISKSGRTMTAVAALALALAAAPVTFGTDGGYELGLSKAFAKDGRDDSGGGDNSGKGGGGKGGSGGSSSGGRGGGDSSGKSGGDSSGRGGGGSDDRSDGRGGDDRGSDDRGGRGGDDDRADDRGGGGDDRFDDRRGRGGSVDRADDRPDRGGDDRGRVPGTAVAAGGGNLRVIKAERSAGGIEVVYSNNLKEEIEAGRYQLKDAGGRTIVERPVTQRDFARISANVRNSGLDAPGRAGGGSVLPAGSQARSVEVSGQGIEVRYATGWKEEVEGSRYELKDPNNNTVVERPATAADRDRMLSLAGG